MLNQQPAKIAKISYEVQFTPLSEDVFYGISFQMHISEMRREDIDTLKLWLSENNYLFLEQQKFDYKSHQDLPDRSDLIITTSPPFIDFHQNIIDLLISLGYTPRTRINSFLNINQLCQETLGPSCQYLAPAYNETMNQWRALLAYAKSQQCLVKVKATNDLVSVEQYKKDYAHDNKVANINWYLIIGLVLLGISIFTAVVAFGGFPVLISALVKAIYFLTPTIVQGIAIVTFAISASISTAMFYKSNIFVATKSAAIPPQETRIDKNLALLERWRESPTQLTRSDNLSPRDKERSSQYDCLTHKQN